jgi:methylphosphotriester-DNA--protein-cysteine methyltransferase
MPTRAWRLPCSTPGRAFERADLDQKHYTVDPAIDLAALLLARDDAPASLEALAQRVGLSTTQLSRRFQAQLGVGIVECNRARLERFLARDVPGGRESILEAALAAVARVATVSASPWGGRCSTVRAPTGAMQPRAW